MNKGHKICNHFSTVADEVDIFIRSRAETTLYSFINTVVFVVNISEFYHCNTGLILILA